MKYLVARMSKHAPGVVRFPVDQSYGMGSTTAPVQFDNAVDANIEASKRGDGWFVVPVEVPATTEA